MVGGVDLQARHKKLPEKKAGQTSIARKSSYCKSCSPW